MSDKLFHIVVARYNESVEWLAPLKKHCRIYNKGQALEGAIQLPNVGRESHTYLRYIIDNYEALPEVVVFTQGAIEEELMEQYPYETQTGDKTPVKFMIELTLSAHENGQSQNFFYNQQISEPYRATPSLRMYSYKGAPLHLINKTLGEWYEGHFEKPYPDSPPWYIHALFAVKRERILQHPKELYERLIKDVETAVDPEVGHFFEKTWLILFSQKDLPSL